MTLYHFLPLQRRPHGGSAPLARPEVEPLVWAIDDWHAPLYFVPRDCPRVCFGPRETTTPSDHERFFGLVTDRLVVAIEARWLDRLRAARLYRYVMPEAPFASLHDNGIHVSRQIVTPLRVEPVGDLLAQFVAAGVELRVCYSLTPLGQAVIRSTMNFSLIRMRNAHDWPAADTP